MNKQELLIASNALAVIAKQNNLAVSEIREHIELAMQNGMCNPDPAIQSSWKSIPSVGKLPTAEEVILCLAKRAQEKEGQKTGAGG